jgi:hypothetical protein
MKLGERKVGLENLGACNKEKKEDVASEIVQELQQ